MMTMRYGAAAALGALLLCLSAGALAAQSAEEPTEPTEEAAIEDAELEGAEEALSAAELEAWQRHARDVQARRDGARSAAPEPRVRE